MLYLDPNIQHVIQISSYVADRMPGIDPVLTTNLLVGTALIESGGVHRRQLGGGPARGLWQMEPDTAMWLVTEYLQYNLGRAAHITQILSAGIPVFHRELFGAVDRDRLMFDIEHNDLLACVLARLKYLTIAEDIPDTLQSQSAYWKRYYNCAGDRGQQAEDYMERWFESFCDTTVKERIKCPEY